MMTGGAGVEDLSFVEENTFVDFYLVARMFANINLYLTTKKHYLKYLNFVSSCITPLHRTLFVLWSFSAILFLQREMHLNIFSIC